MRIVLGCDVRNRYVHQLANFLHRDKRVAETELSLSRFWDVSGEVDLMHVQWPGALFRWEEPGEWQLGWLQDRLEKWSTKGALVATVHNYRPHGYSSERSEKLYRLVYSHADGIIHLGEASEEYFLQRYEFARRKHHTIIAHGNYQCFPDEVERLQARNELGLKDRDFVGLAFGSIRHPEEREVLIDGFDHIRRRSKRLLIAGRFPWPSKRRMRYWRMKGDPRIALHEGWIPHERVQYYCNAADVLIIPRDGSLNSGNVALGFTFGKPVVGPDEGVIGEVLKSTGNPVYQPGNPQSLALAVESVYGKADEIGARNLQYAQEKMNWSNVVDAHVSFYEEVL